jgi:hypothetical protein
MKKHRLIASFAVAALFAASAVAQTNSVIDWNRTNRLSVSVRFGLGISARFKGAGGSYNPFSVPANGRRTPEGDRYNYDDGYVLTDVSGNFGGQTWYWGYDNNSQVSGNNILFNRTTAPGLPASRSADDNSAVGLEVTYNHQFGVKTNWHHMHYGLEAAANYLPISINLNTRFSGTLSRQTDAYPYTPGTTPPGAPYQGSFNGPGFVIGSTPGSSTLTPIAGTTIIENDNFDANLFGFRVGPYVEFPFQSNRLFLHASAGLAVGLLESRASWHETVTIPGEGTTVFSGSRTAFSVLCGGYVSADAEWRLSRRWSVEGGVQFQDLGKFSQKLGIRKVELDLSRSIFLVVGASYRF